jgi:Methylamine utilisation protein MauE
MAGAIVLLFAVIFGLAALSKMRSRAEFLTVLRGLLPAWLAQPVAILIPAGELALAALLLSGIAQRGALVAVLVALSLFTIILIQMGRRGVKGCGCFGESSEEPNIISGVVRNLLLIGATGWLLRETGPISIIGPDTSSFLGRMTIAIGILCLWPCLVALASVRKQFSQPSNT